MQLKHILVFSLLVMYNAITIGQIFPSGFDYQGILRNEGGNPVINSDIDIEVSLYSGENTTILVWQEVQESTTNNDGYYQLIIGEGAPTGQGIVTDFDAINWNSGNYAINIKIDQGSGYEDFGLNQLYSVPFAYYAKQAENQLFINNMTDIDTSSLNTGDILRWSGDQWSVYPYSDTVAWATNALYSTNSLFSDTAVYAISALACPPCDSAIFTFYGDSAMWSMYADTTSYSVESLYSDTALIALEALNTWNLNGNENLGEESFLGSIDSSSIQIRTNNQNRMQISANGNIGIGTDNPFYNFHLVGDKGVLFEGDFATSSSFQPDTGSAMFWLPSKAAFRVGYVNNNAWDLSNIGNYSFAGGYNNKASGNYSFAIGQESIATGEASVAMSWKAKALGKRSIAMGAEATASAYGAIAIGRTAIASDSLGIAIGGKGARAYAKGSIALGYNAKAFADYSVVIGSGAISNHEGAIVIATSGATSTAENQFMVGAKGGTIIYSDAAMTTGVSLAAGSGSWSTLSDSTLKENISSPNVEEIIKKAKALDVYTWNYIAQNDSIRHIGPMAQDFYSAFMLGENETTISVVDIDGINLLLLKSLIEKEEELQIKIIELQDISERLKRINDQNKLIIKRIINIDPDFLSKVD